MPMISPDDGQSVHKSPDFVTKMRKWRVSCQMYLVKFIFTDQCFIIYSIKDTKQCMVALHCLRTATQSTAPTNLSEDGKIKTINTKAHKKVRYILFCFKKTTDIGPSHSAM
jgi:hypothetical protein